jgi:hypothetical protein
MAIRTNEIRRASARKPRSEVHTCGLDSPSIVEEPNPQILGLKTAHDVKRSIGTAPIHDD